ncbi:MAG: SRPBCC family protein [Melioribacteraceae bacterium]|jgi:ligand-binding SRPBCC domain-containing protein|nr:SRPBCC family protein [Melioribacteraceae bacterium]
MHTFKVNQEINASISEAWDFFSSPENLQKITPNHMEFRILSDIKGIKMFPGMIIEYIVKPLFGIPMKWVTEITHVENHKYFIDEQRFGPYKFWHHLHRFNIVDDKLIMEDILHYKLPFGFLGVLINRLFVRKQIEQIFSYRKRTVDKIFNS